MKSNNGTSARLVAVSASAASSQAGLLVLGIILLSFMMRAPLTAVGPIIGDIQRTLGLSGAMTGLLTTLPLLVFALFSPFVPKAAARIGMEATLCLSAAVLAAAIVIRSLPGQASLFAGTALLGAAIAVANVLLPSVVKRDFPERVGLMTGIYTVVMNLGAALGSGLSVPLTEGLGIDWRSALAVTALIAVAAAAVWVPLLRRPGSRRPASVAADAAQEGGRSFTAAPSRSADLAAAAMSRSADLAAAPMSGGTGLAAPPANRETSSMAAPVSLESDLAASASSPGTAPAAVSASGGTGRTAARLWRSPLAWSVSLFLALQSLCFYVSVTWIPSILTDKGLSQGSAGWMLSLMQLVGMLSTFVVPVLAGRQQRQRGLALITALLFVAGFSGLWLGGAGLVVPVMVALGLGAGGGFGLALMFFALRTRTSEAAAELSGMAQAIGYLIAAAGPLLFGMLHDRTGGWGTPLLLIIAVSVLYGVLGLFAGADRKAD